MYILIEFRVYKTRDPCGIIEFPDKNRVLKTPFFFVELEPIRLNISVA